MTTKTALLPVELPEWAEWIAQGIDGTWTAFEIKPLPNDNYGGYYIAHFEGRCENILSGTHRNPNWRETLRRV